MKRFGRAVVAGKFYPPHRGHHLVIETALAQADAVSVLLCVRPEDRIDGELRAAWLREMHPRAEILAIDDRYDEQDSELWARNTVLWLGGAPDAVFASESYGGAYARAMNAAYVAVDPRRQQVPCLATRVRAEAEPAEGAIALRLLKVAVLSDRVRKVPLGKLRFPRPLHGRPVRRGAWPARIHQTRGKLAIRKLA